MEGLKIIENGIVPVYETSTGEKVVYGTELHKVLQVKSNYRDWIKNRLNDCGAIENEDFESFAKNLAKSGRPQTEYIIRLDTAKEMAMLERNKKGKEVRRYFIQVEKKYKIQMAELADSIKQFMKQQTEFNKMVMERLEHMEKPARNSYKANPFLTAGENDIEKRKEELYILTAELAELWDCRHTGVLHCLYNALEEALGIVLDCYKSVYRSETGRQNAGMAEVIASHDWIYKKAVKMCEYAINEKKIFK